MQIDTTNIKELPKKFDGKGEVKGEIFTQIASNDKGYVYKRHDPEHGTLCFEVFKRRVGGSFLDKNDLRVYYPKANSFGVWAWCYPTQEMAMDKFRKLPYPLSA